MCLFSYDAKFSNKIPGAKSVIHNASLELKSYLWYKFPLALKKLSAKS